MTLSEAIDNINSIIPREKGLTLKRSKSIVDALLWRDGYYTIIDSQGVEFSGSERDCKIFLKGLAIGIAEMANY
jgi:hypothetical protein